MDLDFIPASRAVSMRSMKQWTRDKLREGSALREVILSEPDELTASEFLGRLPVYLRLLGLEFQRE